MLLELHVKNLALIEKADVEFGEGLNILTGETGAGKSIIIGSVTMALGGKASKDVIRRGADHAYIELIFFVDSKEKKKALMQLGTEPTEEGMVIISRKIMPSRSVSRINDETVTMARLRQITGLLLDIHGQHEHQSLLHASKHLEILDTYARMEEQGVNGENIVTAKRQIEALMDKLVESYEKQLDRLFAGDVLDITSDIAVMKAMLARDGLAEDLLEPELPRYREEYKDRASPTMDP